MAGSGTAHLRDEGETLLRAENLVVEFPVGKTGLKVHAVTDVSIDVRSGETLGLVGESGCGKSTTGRALMQLPPPTSGSVIYDGQDLTKLKDSSLRAIRPQMQMIFQDPISSLNPRRKVGDIVAEPLRIWKRGSAAEQRRIVSDTLEAVGLDPEASIDRRPHQFSGGQCQRICVARSLVLDPKLIICDEPVSALDVSVQAQILNLLEDMKARYGLTLVFIAHDLAVVKNISDRVAVMYLGKLCEVAKPDDLYAKPAHPYTAALLSSIPVPDPSVKVRESDALAGELPLSGRTAERLSVPHPLSVCAGRLRAGRAEDAADRPRSLRRLSPSPGRRPERQPTACGGRHDGLTGGAGDLVAPGPRRRTRLDPEVRRGQILDAAERVFADRDPNEVTFEELAAAAEVSRALVYNYFGDKNGVVAAVYVRCLHRLHDELEHAIDPCESAPVRLRAGIECYLRFAQHNAGSWRLMSHTSAHLDPEVRLARRERFEELAAGWGGTLDARIAARGMVAFLEGAAVVWIDSGGRNVEGVVEMLFTILWHGLSAVDGSQARPPGESSTRQQYHAATLR